MLWALYPLAAVKEIYRDSVQIGSPPPAPFVALMVISWALLATDRAATLISPNRSQPYVELLLLVHFPKVFDQNCD
jgi:hypothetical protein